MQELVEAVSSGFQDSDVKAIVLTGTGKNFVAGADLTQIYKATEKETRTYPKVNAMSETFSIRSRWVPSRSSPQLTAMRSVEGWNWQWRVITGSAPKASKSANRRSWSDLIPGAGGTQRLPRLIGLPNALEMITVGKPIDADRALSRRLVDEVTDPEDFDTCRGCSRRQVHFRQDLAGEQEDPQ